MQVNTTDVLQTHDHKPYVINMTAIFLTMECLLNL